MALDREETDLGARFKLIQVASAYKVADLAPTIETTLRQSMPPSSGRGRGGRQGGEVSVEAITASNSLLIAGDPKLLAMAGAIVDQIVKMGPAGGHQTIFIRPENISPDEIKRVIEEMMQDNSSQSSRSRRGSGRRR